MLEWVVHIGITVLERVKKVGVVRSSVDTLLFAISDVLHVGET
jgi:hypothetical protein